MSEIHPICAQEIHWVTDNRQLHELCQRWTALPLLAIDTEFIRTNTYYPKSALIQINDGDANYLIDPLRIDDWGPLVALFRNTDIQKVLHSCSEDLEVFNHLFKCLPVNLFDTQIAAAFCGYGFSVGYAGLVEATLGVILPKGETRSDWLQRPLTASQIQYAALDVEYLFQVAKVLTDKLNGSQKQQWIIDECESLVGSYALAQDPANGIQRFKSAWRLSPKSQSVLYKLSYWRELLAQEKDLPRNFVVKEKALYQIAQLMPTQLSQLKNIEEFSEKSVRRYGEEILSIVESAVLAPELEDSPIVAMPMSNVEKKLIKKIREQIESIAKSLAIAPEYLARKRDFEFIARAVSAGATGEGVFPESFRGWRFDLVKESVLAQI